MERRADDITLVFHPDLGRRAMRLDGIAAFLFPLARFRTNSSTTLSCLIARRKTGSPYFKPAASKSRSSPGLTAAAAAAAARWLPGNFVRSFMARVVSRSSQDASEPKPSTPAANRIFMGPLPSCRPRADWQGSAHDPQAAR